MAARVSLCRFVDGEGFSSQVRRWRWSEGLSLFVQVYELVQGRTLRSLLVACYITMRRPVFSLFILTRFCVLPLRSRIRPLDGAQRLVRSTEASLWLSAGLYGLELHQWRISLSGFESRSLLVASTVSTGYSWRQQAQCLHKEPSFSRWCDDNSMESFGDSFDFVDTKYTDYGFELPLLKSHEAEVDMALLDFEAEAGRDNKPNADAEGGGRKGIGL